MANALLETETDPASKNRLWQHVYLRLIKPVLTVKDTPHALALGITIGLWISLTPTVGIQMTLVVVVGTLFKANRIAGVAMTWISNPVTFLPMYYVYYRIGVLLSGETPTSYAALKDTASANTGWNLVVCFFELLGKPLWIGSLLVATVFSIPAYPLCRRYFENREEKRRILAEGTDPGGRPTDEAATN